MGDVKYYESIRSGDITYSIDMLTLRGSYDLSVSVRDYPFSNFITVPFLDAFVARLRDFASQGHFDYQYYESFTFLTYRDMWVCKGEQGETVKFFFGFRGYDSSGTNQWKIQFNPNKIFPCQPLVDLIRWIASVSVSSCRISSFDVAADLPFRRSGVFMVKDRRKYQLVMNSNEDKTEYLGCRGENGFVKLYNKTIESNLSYPLTRFEMSVVLGHDASVFDIDVFRSSLPSVYVLGRQLEFGDSDISDTDSVLLRFCLEHPDGLLMLGKKKKARIIDLFNVVGSSVTFDVLIWLWLYYMYFDLLVKRM